MRAFYADLRKLWRPSIALLAVGWVVALSALTSLHLATAQSQFAVAVSSLELVTNPASPEKLCEFLGQPVGAKCDAAVEEQIGFAQDFMKETSDLYPQASAAKDPMGIGGIVAGYLASLLGIGIVLGIASSHVGGEWGWGTVKVWLARDPRRLRFLVTKTASVWAAGVALLLIGWVVMGALAATVFRHYSVPPSPSGVSLTHFAVEQAFRCILVVAAAAVLGTTVAVLVRSPLASLGVSLALVFLGFVGTASSSVFEYSPAYWIGSWMRFTSPGQWRDHIWPDSFPLIDPIENLQRHLVLSGILIAALSLAGFTVGLLALRLKDVRG